MQIVRTVIWVLLLVGLLLFSIANWDPTVTVRIWEGIVVDTKIPAIVIVAFAIGFVPMWLYHRASKWRMQRKMQSLEHAARTSAATPVARPHEDEVEASPAEAEMHQDTETPLRPAGTYDPPAASTTEDTSDPDEGVRGKDTL